MLTIRKDQIDVLSHAMLGEFIKSACLHLRKCWPEQCESRDEEALRTSVQLAVEHARRYGITTERGVIRFLDVMYLLGDDFDLNPEPPWATPILRHQSMPGWAKADRLWTEAKQHAQRRQAA